MGYGKYDQTGSGLHLRQWARSFVISDKKNSMVFVSVDVGMIGDGLRIKVSSGGAFSRKHKFILVYFQNKSFKKDLNFLLACYLYNLVGSSRFPNKYLDTKQITAIFFFLIQK